MAIRTSIHTLSAKRMVQPGNAVHWHQCDKPHPCQHRYCALDPRPQSRALSNKPRHNQNFMNTSLDTVHIPFLRSIRFSVQDYYAWSDGLAQNLATRLAKFSSPVVLDIALEYIAVWDALDSISQHLGAALRRLKLKSSLMAANVATLDPDVLTSPSGSLSTPNGSRACTGL